MFSEDDAKDTIMMHRSEIATLYGEISAKYMEKRDVTYIADTWYEESNCRLCS
jgi:hypothetical protein